jgi:hypothetical protein
MDLFSITLITGARIATLLTGASDGMVWQAARPSEEPLIEWSASPLLATLDAPRYAIRTDTPAAILCLPVKASSQGSK